ncbi:MAG: S8 family serine peptidase [Candidatus Diapherotrites archaeon]|nr:S8 family serine peptidase [Candidatus Diapherotrites archaeon]
MDSAVSKLLIASFLVIASIAVLLFFVQPQPTALVTAVSQQIPETVFNESKAVPNGSLQTENSDSDSSQLASTGLSEAGQDSGSKGQKNPGIPGSGAGAGLGGGAGSSSSSTGLQPNSIPPVINPPASASSLSSEFAAVFSPSIEEVSLAEGETASFSASPNKDANFEWQLDGMQISSEKNFAFKTMQGFEGSYFLQAFARNGNEMKFKSWNITVKKPSGGYTVASQASTEDLNALKKLHSSLKQFLLSAPSIPQTVILTVRKGSAESIVNQLKNIGINDANIIPPGVLIAVRLSPSRFLQLAKISGLDFLNPNFKYSAMETVNPNISQVGAPLVWAKVLNDKNITGKGVKVGVLDTGINSRNAYLGYRVGLKIVFYDPWGYGPLRPEDALGTGHGSHVAGIVAGGKQGTRVDYNWNYFVGDYGLFALINSKIILVDSLGFTFDRNFESGSWDVNYDIIKSTDSLRCTLSNQTTCSETYPYNIGTGTIAATLPADGNLNLWVYFSNPASLKEINIYLGTNSSNYRLFKQDSGLPASPGWFKANFNINQPYSSIGSLTAGNPLNYSKAQTVYSVPVSTQDFFDYLVIQPAYCRHNASTDLLECSQVHDINSIGIAPDANIWNITVMDELGNGDVSAITGAMLWAADQGIKVQNLSLGRAANDPNDPIVLQMKALHDFNYDVSFVVSAGNCGNEGPDPNCGSYRGITTPGISQDAITVAAVDSSNQKAGFSSSGEGVLGKPDLAAPGVNINSGFRINPYYYASDTTAVFSGTSMSAPHVTGAVALMLQAKPDLNWQEVKNFLSLSAKDLGPQGFDVNYGWGLLDLNSLWKPRPVFSQNPAFWSAEVGSFADFNVSLANNGFGDLNVTGIIPSSPRIQAWLDSNNVSAFSSTLLNVKVDSNNAWGGFNGIVHFENLGGSFDLNIYGSFYELNPPVTTSDINDGVWRAFDANVHLACNDGNASSGCAWTNYRLDSNPSSGTSFGGWQPYSGPILFSTDGNFALEFYSVDNAFNFESAKIAFVLIDKISPATISDANSNWQNFDAGVSLACIDDWSGCALTQFRVDSDASNSASFGAWQAYSNPILFSADGNFALDFNSIDNAGNVEATKRVFVLIDKTAPLTISDINSAWQNFDANVHLTCFDANSGCALTQYRLDIDSGSVISFGAWQNYSSLILISSDGNFALDFNSTDNAGNVELTKHAFVLIDKNAPSVSAVSLSGAQSFANFINGNSVNWSAAVSDAASGLNPATCETSSTVSWTAGNYSAGNCFTLIPISINNGTNYQFGVRIRDNVSNQGQSLTMSYTGDTAAPTTTASGCPLGWNNSNQTIALACSDSSGSGCSLTRYRIDGGVWQSGNSISLTTDGNHKVDFNSSDNLGNYEVLKTIYCAVDKFPPSIPSLNAGAITNSSIEVIASGSVDSLSGLHALPYWFEEYVTSPSNSGWQASSWIKSSLNPNTQYFFNVKARDSANNEAGYGWLQKFTLANNPRIVSVSCSISSCSVYFDSNGNPDTEYYIDENSGNPGGSDLQWNVIVSPYGDSGLSAGTQYCYQIKARNGNQAETVFSTLVCATTVITAPVLSATAQTTKPINSSQGAVSLSWSDITGETSYTAYRSVNGVNYARILSGDCASTPANDIACLDDILSDNNLYYYKIQANSAGGDINSNVAAAFTPDRTQPENFTLSVAANNSLNREELSWTQATDNNTPQASIDYNIFKSLDGVSFNYLNHLVGSAAFNDASAKDFNAPNSTSISAINSNSPASISLNWNASADNGSNYYYYLSAIDWQKNWRSSNSGNAIVATGLKGYYARNTTSSTEAFTSLTNSSFSGLTANSQYCFTVKAQDNADNNSTASSQLCTFTLANKPRILSVSCAVNDCTVSIDLNNNPLGTDLNVGIVQGAANGGSDSGWFASSSNPETFIDSGLQPGTQYCYVVKARNGNSILTASSQQACGTTALSGSIVLTATAQSNKPKNSSLGRITLSWNDISGEIGYDVFRSLNGISFSKIASSLPANSTSYDNDNLNDNNSYYYKVQAISSTSPIGDMNSNTASAVTLDRTSPSAVSNLAASYIVNQSNLSWTQATDNSTPQSSIDYNILRSLSGIVYNRIGAVRGQGNYSDTTARDNAAPQAPSLPLVNADSNVQLTVSWALVADNGNSYYFKLNAVDAQQNDSNSNTSLVNAVSGLKDYNVLTSGGASRIDSNNIPNGLRLSGLNPNINYCFQIAARDNALNLSPYSAQACKFTLANIPIINGVSCNTSSCNASFNLAGNPAGTQYFIDEITGNSGGTDFGWSTAASPYVDSGLLEATQYCYRIKARNLESVETAFSQQVCSTTGSTPIACSNDVQCSDSNSYTQDSCINPGTPQSYCSYQPIACISSTDCNDANAHTFDSCINPGTIQSYCSFESIACLTDSECDDSNPSTTDSCTNAGTPSAYCTNNLTQYCGNGAIDSGEQCDGVNLNSQTCQFLGFSTGSLACNANCTFNTSQCITAPVLRLFLPLEQNALDSSAFNNNGTLLGNSRIADDATRGKVLKLDGTANSYVRIADNASLDFGNQNFTVMAWAKTSNKLQQFLLAKTYFDAAPGYGFYREQVYLSNGQWWNQGDADSNKPHFAASGSPLDSNDWRDGKWHHVAAVFNREQKRIDIFIDSQLKTSWRYWNPAKESSIDNDLDLLIGAGYAPYIREPSQHGTVSGFYYDGSVDNVRIYDKTLTQAQIQEVYTAEFLPEAPASCGNGIADANEQCDLQDLAGKSCNSLGFDLGGSLSCTASCRLNTSQCSESPNLILNGSFADWNNSKPDIWYWIWAAGNGTIEQSTDSFDASPAFKLTSKQTYIGVTSNLIDVLPGDNVTLIFSTKVLTPGQNYWAKISSTDWNQQWYLQGGSPDWSVKTITATVPQNLRKLVVQLGIGPTNDINTSVLFDAVKFRINRPQPVCGNGVIEGTERCDSANLNNNSCNSLGFDLGGTLTCSPACDFDTALCNASQSLVLNGGFEQWQNSLPLNWGKAYCVYGPQDTVVQQSTDAFEGSLAVKVSSTAPYCGIYSQQIDVNSGQTLTLTFRARSGTVGNTYWGRIASSDYQHQAFVEDWGHEWESNTVNFVVPQGVSKVYIQLGAGYTNGIPTTTFFDNLRVRKS